jgi:hypothetical protein
VVCQPHLFCFKPRIARLMLVLLLKSDAKPEVSAAGATAFRQ